MSFKDSIVLFTFGKNQKMWMRSFARNMSEILNGKDIRDLPKHSGEPCLVVGAGPSVKRFRQLDLLAKSGWQHPIVCADRMVIPLLKRGIVPKICTTVDGDRVISKFYKHPLVEKYADEVKAVFSAPNVHPKVVKTCPFKKYWFLSMWDSPTDVKSLTRAFHFMTGKTIMEAYGNAGSCAWALAYFLGFSPIGMVGIDYSYLTADVTKTTYYETFKILSKGDAEKLRQCFKRVRTWAGHEVLTDSMWLVYLQLFLPALNKAKVATYNLSPTSIVTSERVKGMELEQFLKKYS